MGVIQSSINSMMGTASIAAGLFAASPVGKRISENRNLKAADKSLAAARQSISANEKLSQEERASAVKELAEKQADVAERRFYNKPTTQSAIYAMRERFVNDAATDEMPGVGTSPQEQAALRAKQSRDNAINAKKKQRRNFMDYLKQQPTSLGGKVGDLPPQAQKQIAGQYTRSQRKRLMDMADKGGRNG